MSKERKVLRVSFVEASRKEVPLQAPFSRWYYLGTDFLAKCRWDNACGSEKRIPFQKSLSETLSELRPKLVEFVEDLRIQNAPRADDWWMTHLAGKTSTVTPFFLHCCLLQRLVEDINASSVAEDGGVVVVCEDLALLKAAFETFSARATSVKADTDGVVWCLQTPWFLWMKMRLWTIQHLARTLIRWSVHAVRYVGDWFSAGKHDGPTRRIRVDATPCIVLHTCVDEACFLGDGGFRDRYFGLLPGWLRAKGYRVVTIPWIYNIARSTKEAHAFLAQAGQEFFFLEAWAGPWCFLSASLKHCRVVFLFPTHARLTSLSVGPLLVRERWAALVAVETIRFRVAEDAVARWLGSGNVCAVYVDAFENILTEKTLFRAFARLSPRTRRLGYQHTLFNDELLGYFPGSKELSEDVFPDVFVSNGPIAAERLRLRGFPAERVLEGPALRQSYLSEASLQKGAICLNREETGLVLLPLDLATACEGLAVFVDLLNQAPSSVKTLLARVRLRAHPMMRRERLLVRCGLKTLPEGWEWDESSLAEGLGKALFVVGMGTGALMDAAAAGRPVLCLQREFGFDQNPLAHWQHEFTACRTLSKDELLSALEVFAMPDKAKIVLEAPALMARVRGALGGPTDDVLSVFLP